MNRSRRRFPRLAALLVLLGAALGPAGAARANGAFPDEFSIHFAPDAPHRIYLGANFGLLVSEDDGATWRYACEPWVVSSSNAALASASVSFYQVTADGALLANSITMTRSSDVACTWPTSTGSISGQSVADFFPDPNDASRVLAVVVLPGASYIVASHDGGKTFDAPHLYDTPDLLTGVEIARSNPAVVYATSNSPSGGAAKFLASANSGATWTPTDMAIDPATTPRILAVDPANEKIVYVRVVGAISDAIWKSVDGGQTFTTMLPPVGGQLSSFLLANDGAIYAGTRGGKLYVQPAGTTGFAARDSYHLRCLGQRPGTNRIYACTDFVLDGFSIATSDDKTATFQPLMTFTQILGPLTCPPVQTNCQAHWSRIQGVLGISPAPDAGQGGSDGGTTPSGGSHCASAGVDAWSLWVALGVVARRRRRRRAL